MERMAVAAWSDERLTVNVERLTFKVESYISRRGRRERRLFIYQRDGTDSHGGIKDLGFVFLEITQTSLDSSKGN